MPLSIVCDACKAKLNIPETLAGKRVKCPKCQAAFTVPAAGAAAAAQPAPKPDPARPAPPAARPAATKPAAAPLATPSAPTQATTSPPAKQAPGLNPVILAAAGGGALVVLGVIVGIGFWLANSGGQPVAARANPANNAAAPANAPAPSQANVEANPLAPTIPPADPANNPTAAPSSPPQAETVAKGSWTEFADEKMGFHVFFPAAPTDHEPPAPKEDSIAAKFQQDMLKSMKEKGQLRMMQAVSGGRTYLVSATALPLVGMSADQYFDRMEPQIGALHPGFELVGKSTRGSHDGHRYCDLQLKSSGTQKVVRMMPAQGFIYGLIVEGAGVSPTDGDVTRFLASLKLSTPQQPEKPAPKIAANTPAKVDPPTTTPAASPADPATPVEPAPPPKPMTEPAPAPIEPAVPLGPPFAGKKTQFTVRFPEGATTRAVDTLKAFNDAKKRNEAKDRWNDDKALYESFAADHKGWTFLVTAWRDRQLTGNEANNAQLKRIRDLLSDQLKSANARPTIVNSPLAAKVENRGLYTRRYRKDGKLIIYQEIRAGAFAAVLQVQCPSEVDEQKDPQIWAYFNSLEVTP